MKTYRLPCWTVIGLAVAGCQLLPDRPPPQTVHDFGPVRGNALTVPAPWSQVTVKAPDWLQDRLIRYRLLYAQPTQVRYYSQSRWIAPPPELLANRLGAACSDSGIGLTIAIQSFEQVFEHPGQSTVVLQARAELVDARSAKALGIRSFRWSTPTPSGDAPGAVAAFARLADLARSELSSWAASLAPVARTSL